MSSRDMKPRDFIPGAIIATLALTGLVLVAALSDVHDASSSTTTLWKAMGKLLWRNASARPVKA